MSPLRSSPSPPSSPSTSSTAQATPVNPEYSELVSGMAASTPTASSRRVRTASAVRGSRRVRASWLLQTARPADPDARDTSRRPAAGVGRRVPASVPATWRARSLSAPDSSGARDAPAPSTTGASRNGAARPRVSRSYPVPAEGPSADLGCGSCCRELGSKVDVDVAGHALAHAAVRLLGTDADESVVVLAVAAARDRPPCHVGDRTIPDSRSLPDPHKWAT